VAGDQLKTASDLGVPVVGVGLLYQQGYFRQMIDRNGSQQALYPYNDPGQLPIKPLRRPNGEWLRLEIALPGYSLWLRAWQVQVGRVRLYLLDSNDAVNFPIHRGITSELYGGNSELRLKQEMILGIDGWRLLEALGFQPQVCHLNEGHAAFAVLERARSFMQHSRQPFDVALAVTRVGNLFTTHTAVEAGFDRVLARSHGALSRQLCAGKARRFILRLDGAGTPKPSRRRAFQHGLSRSARQRSNQWCEPSSRASESSPLCAAFPALARRRGPGRIRDEWSPYADLGLGGGGRSVDLGLRKGSLAGNDGNLGGRRSNDSGRAALETALSQSRIAHRLRSDSLTAATVRVGRFARCRGKRKTFI
jgi:hypothetical protein